MTFESVVALLTSLAEAVGLLTKRANTQDARMAALEERVQAHDSELKPAPPPGPIQKEG